MAIFITRFNRDNYLSTLLDTFKLRHVIFNKWLKWDLPHHNDMEFDEFDEQEDTIHVVSLCPKGEVLGTWRLMPTITPYMTEIMYPEIFGDRPVVKAENVWELSRFAVNHKKIKELGMDLREVSRDMYGAIAEFCYTHQIGELLSVQHDDITAKANHILGDPIWSGPANVLSADEEVNPTRILSYEIPEPSRLFGVYAEIGLSGPRLEEHKILTEKPQLNQSILETLLIIEKELKKSDRVLAARLIGGAIHNLQDDQKRPLLEDTSSVIDGIRDLLDIVEQNQSIEAVH